MSRLEAMVAQARAVAEDRLIRGALGELFGQFVLAEAFITQAVDADAWAKKVVAIYEATFNQAPEEEMLICD